MRLQHVVMVGLLVPLLAAQPEARDLSDAVNCAVGLVHGASTGAGYPQIFPPSDQPG